MTETTNPTSTPPTPGEQTAGKAGTGRPSGLVLAGAGSLLAVLAFLGGTAVGHAWGGSSGSGQTQFNGPGGGRFGQGTGPGTQQGQGNQQQPGSQGGQQIPQQGQVPGQTQTG